jgi:tetratricopeptide (TPR) repeat protein
MSPRIFLTPVIGCVCALPWSVIAQEEDLGTLIGRAQDAMKAERWEEALVSIASAEERFGKAGQLMAYGPQFGAVFFHKGTCLMKLKRWDDAMRSFEICYRDFPNTVLATENGNVFQKMALLRWGEAAMAAGNWELALSRFRKFLKERDRERDIYPQGAFHIGMAICEYRSGRIPEGNENLEIAIRNKHMFPTPETGIVAAFQSLVGAALAARNEQALLDFIGGNRGGLVIEPFRMYRFSQVFLTLAAEATAADMPRAAMALYQFVPPTEAAMDDIRARLKAMGPLASIRDGADVIVRKDLEAELAALDELRRGKNPPESLKLVGTAVLHEKCGNIHGALAAYQQLESLFQNSGSREGNLFNLVRTSAAAASTEEVARHAATFLTIFPESPQLPAVANIALTRLFGEGDHEKSIRLAALMLEKLAADAEEYDTCLHVLGASYFHTGLFKEAAPLLEKHALAYPKSRFSMATAYLNATNTSRLGDRAKAEELLVSFINTYPPDRDNIYLPFALRELADCQFAAGRKREALATLGKITADFSGTDIACRAWDLKGNIELDIGETKDAENSWMRALESAEARQDREVAGDSLASLVCLLARAQDAARLKTAASLADRFWKDHAQNPARSVRVAIAQVPALSAVGRSAEALERLREMIAAAARTPRGDELDALIRAHSAAFLAKHKPVELKALYQDFPGIGLEDRAVRARLSLAVIAAYEKSGDAAAVRALYQELKTSFPMKELPNTILIRIADHLRLATSTPREALIYYDELIARENATNRADALLGRADVLSHSGSNTETAKATGDLERVLKEFPGDPASGHARARLAELSNASPTGK